MMAAKINPHQIKESRIKLLHSVKRVVIKIGSGVLTKANGLNLAVINNLTKDICCLIEDGIEVIIVSSGAIAAGLKKVGLSKRPQSISQQQAVAAIGQSSLMIAYEKAFQQHRKQKIAQILITRDDLTHRRRYLNARNTLFTLLAWNIVPIINENDTVVVDEIKFGDNDNLSAMITNLSEAQLLVNLTNIDGLFDMDPREHENAVLINVVEKVDRKVTKYANSIPGFLGTGGMTSKIKAARKVALAGVPTIIANGLKPDIIKLVFSGESEGTIFLPEKVTLCRRKHWIAFTKYPKGEILIDSGAENALLDNGKSLLPSGIKDVKGRFSKGDTVILLNEDLNKIAIGMVNYHSSAIKKIMGFNSDMIYSKLGFKDNDEVIHRENLVLTDKIDEGDDGCYSMK